MTTIAATAAPAEMRIPFGRLLKVEFRKSWDTRAGFWLLFSIGGLVLVAELIAAIVRGIHDHEHPLYVAAGNGMQWGDFATVAGVVTELLLPVLGILLVTGEWSQRTGMVTFTMEPRRSMVIWSKALVGVLLSLATVVFVVLAGAVFNALYGAIAGHIDWSFSVKGLIGFFIAQVLAMLTGFAFACLCLSSPASIVVYVALRFVVPTLIAIGENLMSWFNSFGPWIDFQNAQTPLYDWSFTGKEWGQLIVSGLIWLVLPLVIGVWHILRAEVK